MFLERSPLLKIGFPKNVDLNFSASIEALRECLTMFKIIIELDK
jgi:hypothetical protein